jgi:hypothetical protein
VNSKYAFILKVSSFGKIEWVFQSGEFDQVDLRRYGYDVETIRTMKPSYLAEQMILFAVENF